MNARHEAPVSLDPASHAQEAVEMASLGKCCIGEINHYLTALVELGNVTGLPDKELRKRCAAIKGIAEMGARFADEMQTLMGCENGDHEAALEAVLAAQKGGA